MTDTWEHGQHSKVSPKAKVCCLGFSWTAHTWRGLPLVAQDVLPLSPTYKHPMRCTKINYEDNNFVISHLQYHSLLMPYSMLYHICPQVFSVLVSLCREQHLMSGVVGIPKHWLPAVILAWISRWFKRRSGLQSKYFHNCYAVHGNGTCTYVWLSAKFTSHLWEALKLQDSLSGLCWA